MSAPSITMPPAIEPPTATVLPHPDTDRPVQASPPPARPPPKVGATAVLLVVLDVAIASSHLFLASRLCALVLVILLPGATIVGALRVDLESRVSQFALVVGAGLATLMGWALVASASAASPRSPAPSGDRAPRRRHQCHCHCRHPGLPEGRGSGVVARRMPLATLDDRPGRRVHHPSVGWGSRHRTPERRSGWGVGPGRGPGHSGVARCSPVAGGCLVRQPRPDDGVQRRAHTGLPLHLPEQPPVRFRYSAGVPALLGHRRCGPLDAADQRRPLCRHAQHHRPTGGSGQDDRTIRHLSVQGVLPAPVGGGSPIDLRIRPSMGSGPTGDDRHRLLDRTQPVRPATELHRPPGGGAVLFRRSCSWSCSMEESGLGSAHWWRSPSLGQRSCPTTRRRTSRSSCWLSRGWCSGSSGYSGASWPGAGPTGPSSTCRSC